MATVNVDRIARTLVYGGRMARSMPPSWDGARDAPLCCGPEGQYVGKMLPGRGLYLGLDLKSLGITRPLPYVYERSPLMRAAEAIDTYGVLRGRVFDAERLAVRFLDGLRIVSGRLVPACAITTYDGIIAARAGGLGQDVVGIKGSITTVASAWSSLFRATGLPGVGTYSNIPGGAAPNRTNAGALSLGLSNPTGANKKYLLTLGVGLGNNTFWTMLVDLLVAAGNILATTAAAQTVNTTALTRYTDGAGVMITFEVTTLLSATAHNITVNSYTDQAGNAGHTSSAQTGINAGIVNRLAPTDFAPFVALGDGGLWRPGGRTGDDLGGAGGRSLRAQHGEAAGLHAGPRLQHVYRTR
jgi:hypothetical protein